MCRGMRPSSRLASGSHRRARGLCEAQQVLFVLAPRDVVAAAAGVVREPAPLATQLGELRDLGRQLGEGVLGEDDDAEAAELVGLEGRRAEDEGRVVGEGLVLLLVHRVALGGGGGAGEVEVEAVRWRWR